MAVVIPLQREKKTEKITPELYQAVKGFRTALAKVLLGKESIIDSILCAILSQGHILLEDVPGVGKTTVIKALSKLLGLEMKRIQCTSDLLPSDIIGVEVFNNHSQQFVFHPGPVFAHVVLADELNRASPRTQSALLEAMGEGMVTVDRKSYSLPKPFILFAAQNPSDHLGTYPLPESQLDRFAVKIHLDYPNEEKEKEIFSQASLDPLKSIEFANLSIESLQEIQDCVDNVLISPRVADYVKRFVETTRNHPSLRRGVSTRGGVAWLRLARARAVLLNRDYVIPDDLVSTGVVCLSHRVVPQTGNDGRAVIENLLSTVDIE